MLIGLIPPNLERTLQDHLLYFVLLTIKVHSCACIRNHSLIERSLSVYQLNVSGSDALVCLRQEFDAHYHSEIRTPEHLVEKITTFVS